MRIYIVLCILCLGCAKQGIFNHSSFVSDFEKMVSDTIPDSVTLRHIDAPYDIDHMGNREVWAAVQGINLPVPDNKYIGPQNQQSPHRKIWEDGIFLDGVFRQDTIHTAIVVDYWYRDGIPVGYKMESGGLWTIEGRYIATCTFYVGFDSYMKSDYEGVLPFARLHTNDGHAIPIYRKGSRLTIRVHNGQWWNGDHPTLSIAPIIDWPYSL